MKKYLLLLAVAILTLAPAPASAVTCYWVGGTAQWTAVNAVSWSSSSGGAGSSCAGAGGVPGSSDVALFTAASGGGVVTVNTTVNVNAIDMGAFTGTLDFSANNNNVTLATGFAATGTSARTFNMGNGTWTITGTGIVWDLTTTTNLTFTANSSIIILTDIVGQKVFRGGGLTYNTFTINGGGNASSVWITGANTFTTLNISGGNTIQLTAGLITTITNATNWTGTPTGLILIKSDTNASSATITSASNGTYTWAAFRDVAFNGGGTFVATNSFNLSGPSLGVTVTPPNVGTTACILGGWLLWRDMPEHINDNFPAWLNKAA